MAARSIALQMKLPERERSLPRPGGAVPKNRVRFPCRNDLRSSHLPATKAGVSTLRLVPANTRRSANLERFAGDLAKRSTAAELLSRNHTRLTA